MATSIGSAAAAGLESGFGLGLRAIDQQERSRDRQRREAFETEELAERRGDREDQRRRLVTQDKRLADQDDRVKRQDERQTTIDGLKVMDAEVAELGNEGAALFQQYGGYDKVPEDVRGEYSTRVRAARERRAQARRGIYEPTIGQQKKDAAEKWSRIQTGQLSMDDLSDDDLVRTLTVQTRRDLGDFLTPEGGGPSRIQQAGLDLEAGLETGNLDLTLRAANVLLAPELRTGVGTEGRDGSEIVSKEIVQMVPHPQDPSQVVPIVKVTVRRDDGALGSYAAPITENRSSDPADNVKTLSMKDAFDRVGQLTTLAEALNRPDMRKRIEAGSKGGGKAGADEFLQALSSVGVKPPTKQVSRSTVDLGDRVLERETDATGTVIGERELRKGAPPKQAGSGSGGKPPPGYRFTLDGDLEAIPGGPAFAKAEAKSDKARASQNAAIAQADRLISTIDSALGKVGLNTAGLGGAVMGKLPGSEAKDMASELETVKANLGFAELQAMREASPTGGALGAIAVQELVALQSTVASLDQKQSPGQLRQSLNKIKDHYQTWRKTVIEAGQEGEASAPAEREKGATGGWGDEPPQIAVNPKTGERLMLRGGQWVPVQ